MSPLKIGSVGTGIFATDSHLPTMKNLPELYKPLACCNTSKDKAASFALKAGIPPKKIYDSLDEIFLDNDLDAIDATLPVQLNLDVVKLALKYNKLMCFEKPIAATVEQAREIVKLTKNSDVPIMVLEQWSYCDAVKVLKEQLASIGKVISFTYKVTGPHQLNKYLKTAWRLKPQHVGGYLSDGGVHQLALLTGVLGHFKSVSAHTVQLREVSGTDDILYSVAELDSGVFGTFTYGGAFGACKKTSYFEILGDKGSLLYDFSEGIKPHVRVMHGDSGDEPVTETIEVTDQWVDNDYMDLKTEFQVFAKLVQSNDRSQIITTPEVCFHHLAFIDAAIKSSRKGGDKVLIERP